MPQDTIKGKELIQLDGSLETAARLLLEVKENYESLSKEVRQKAVILKRSIESNTDATRDQLQAQQAQAKEVQKLARAEARYQVTLGDVGKRLASVRLEQAKHNQLLKAQARLARAAEGSFDQLSAQYSINKIRLNGMSREQREAAESSDKLVTRTRELFNEMKRLQAETGKTSLNVGNYTQAIQDALSAGGGRIGGIGQGLGNLGRGAGVAGLAAGAVIAADAVIDLGDEFFRLEGQLQSLGGIADNELSDITSKILAISRSFDTSTNEVTIAANALAKNIGISFDDALNRIEDGFIAGLDINGEFLDSLREYPTFFREAFGEGEQAANALFATIQKGVQGGLFSDKAVDSVKEVALRLRELTTATTDALEGIGLSGEQIRQEIAERGVGAAIALVSERLSQLEADSPQVGAAIADIFGGAGEDAGLDFLLSLKDINEATRISIDQSSEYQVAQKRIADANEEYAKAQGRLAESIGGTGSSLEEVGVKLKTFGLNLANGTVNVLNSAASWIGSLFGVRDASEEAKIAAKALRDETGEFKENAFEASIALRALDEAMQHGGDAAERAKGIFDLLNDAIDDTSESAGDSGRALRAMAEQMGPLRNILLRTLDTLGIYGESVLGAEKNMRRWTGMTITQREALEETDDATTDTSDSTDNLASSLDRVSVSAEQFAEGTLGFLRQQLRKLNKELEGADAEEYAEQISKIIATEKQISDLERLADELRHIAELKKIAGEDEELGFNTRELQFNGLENTEDNILVEIIPTISVPNDLQNRVDEALRGLKIKPTEVESDEPRDIFSFLGIDLGDEQKEALTSAFSFAKAQLFEFYEFQTQIARDRENDANNVVRSAEAALQAEISREEDGLASRVQARRRDLANAKATQKQATEERRKAERQERNIRNIEQAGNLISASAKIWGQLGFPAAIPAIALMFGSFAAAKIKAGKLAKQTFRKGTWQVLGGGSHESGNDTYVGTNDKGDMYAESGEGVAVVKEKRVKQYGGTLNEIYRSIDNGRLYEWIDGHANKEEIQVNHKGNTINVDTSLMEDRLGTIAKNTDRVVYTRGDGKTVVQEGNRTTVYH